MRIVEAGPLKVRALGGDDRQGGGDGPSVVLLHGYGVPGNDLVLLPRLARVATPQPLRWFFPEGPLVIDGQPGGPARAWYAVDRAAIQRRVEAEQPPYPIRDSVPPGMDGAVDQVEACLDVLAREHGVAPSRTILGGFSQGAVMATALVLRHRPLFAGAALLSGRLLEPDAMEAPLRELGAELQVFLAHGTADAVIPFANGVALRDVLQAHGASLEWFPYPGGHAITSEVHAALASYCLRRLGPTLPAP